MDQESLLSTASFVMQPVCVLSAEQPVNFLREHGRFMKVHITFWSICIDKSKNIDLINIKSNLVNDLGWISTNYNSELMKLKQMLQCTSANF